MTQAKRDRREYYTRYNIQRAEKKRQQRREKYAQSKAQQKENLSKYYGAEAYKILMTFKEYTELNKEKKKLWLNFCWTLKDCQAGIGDIVDIMKLEQVADNLIRDYWETAKQEKKKKTENWNFLTNEEQQRLIKYWGYEKARVENKFLTTAEELEQQSQEYLKDLDIAKHHEERGKINCECWQCEQKKQLREEIQNEQENIIKDYDQATKEQKTQCFNCGKFFKNLDEEEGVCRSCLRQLQG